MSRCADEAVLFIRQATFIVSRSENVKLIIGLTVVWSLAVAIGIWVGIAFAKKEEVQPDNPLIAGASQKFEDVLAYIERDYVDDTDTQRLSEVAVGDLVKQLDPHSAYLSARELALSNVALQGELEGVGIEFIVLHGAVYIIAPISGGPSAQVGIRPGDRIIGVDDAYFLKQYVQQGEILEKLRGARGTKVKLTIRRSHVDIPLEFTITRDKLSPQSVDVSYMIDDQTGYLKISRFTANTFKEFKTAFHSLQKQGMHKLLLDLRGNPGGYINTAIEVANALLDQGQLIVYTKGRVNKYNAKHYAKGEDKFDRCPVVVLIDEGTAAAAEIVAGALQDNDRALIVGQRSFGKGLVQVPIQLNDGSQLRLTAARYYTPSGRFIQKSYVEGMTDEQTNLISKYKRGEYFHADNIQFDDTLKYLTPKGRTVYGGGGIMPDYFVLRAAYTDTGYLEQPHVRHILQQYASEYADKHREALIAMGYEKFYHQFETSDLSLKKLVAQASSSDVSHEDLPSRIDKMRAKLLLKAYIARDLWKEYGFYPIYHQEDEAFQQAIQLLDEAEALIT